MTVLRSGWCRSAAGVSQRGTRTAEIVYRQRDKLVAVGVVTRAGHIAVGKTTVLFEGPYKPAGVSSRSYDVSHDGNRFLMVRREPARPRSKPVITLVTNWLEELKRRAATRTSE